MLDSSRLLLEVRRHALEEWMQKLLSDIDLSRSALVAAFLEAVARSCLIHLDFQEWNHCPCEGDSSAKRSTNALLHPDELIHHLLGISV